MMLLGPAIAIFYGFIAYWLFRQGSPSTLWVVGRQLDTGEWEFQGIFTSKDKALDMCNQVDNFLFQMPVNVFYPIGSWLTEAEFPRRGFTIPFDRMSL